ncbi:aldehyde ferredoxin oxidoreductase family protein [Halobiforma nitratireducens]|uniref:Aldehyde ferredoxin oxidoreductase n=1 Tax=Halobiforma nitratireducens JCM 10879 TaxID=1227454 RepID=M0LQH0_9EURY|nr:aldehyde ferredoxin oxidoreductase C-terminal domain-containing protein [Halobiforma nitratireducens]EMA35348.1 aldehyde ferredoxin oxidoreductase [Halobiforma nitratireducens JCM 10879]
MVDRPSVLRANLTAGEVEKERVPDQWRRRFLGGKGLGVRYLYDALEAGVDPLGPDNLLGFFVGPLAGALPGESRYAAVTKSPLTGLFLDSYAGGAFASRLAGSLEDCRALVVTGASDDPVRIVVEDGTAEIEPAETWGADTVETGAAHPDAAVACIGPAGERQVRYATIASDAGDHQAGRGGAGAVMGSKRLKAVVAAGPPADPPTPELARLRETYAERYATGETGSWQATSATLESIDFADAVDALATNGWRERTFDGIEDIGVEAARDASVGREYPDEPVPGGFRVETDDGETVPRGATQMSLGAGLGIDDFDAVAELGALCDRLGLDVISAGNAVAWVARAREAGAIEAALEFGDGEGARALITAIADGVQALEDAASGDLELPCDPAVVATLRDGVDTAAARFGVEPIPTVKSMALPAYDPRGAAGMALAYATSDRGGCHRRARPIEEEVFAAWDRDERVTAVRVAQDVRSVLWSLVADDFAGETLWHDCGTEFFEALTDAETVDVAYPTDPDALYRTGERIWTLVRLFNAREGVDRHDDRLPEPLFAGDSSDEGGVDVDAGIDPDAFEALLSAYYRARGWGRDGLPTERTLERLDLAPVRDEQTPVGTAFAAASEGGGKR